MLSTLTFVNMLISWVLYRLYYYPTIAINSAMFESIEEGVSTTREAKFLSPGSIARYPYCTAHPCKP